MHTDEVIGVEALIRWQHPGRGLDPPLEFLPVIEDHAISLVMGDRLSIGPNKFMEKHQRQL